MPDENGMILSQEMFDAIINDIEETDASTRSCCEKYKISWRSFRKDCEKCKEREMRYARARIFQAEHLLDRAREIEDEAIADIKASETKIGNALATMYRQKIEDRKWFASKLLPKKYGDKIEVETKTITDSVLVESPAGKEKIEIRNEQKEVSIK